MMISKWIIECILIAGSVHGTPGTHSSVGPGSSVGPALSNIVRRLQAMTYLCPAIFPWVDTGPATQQSGNSFACTYIFSTYCINHHFRNVRYEDGRNTLRIDSGLRRDGCVRITRKVHFDDRLYGVAILGYDDSFVSYIKEAPKQVTILTLYSYNIILMKLCNFQECRFVHDSGPTLRSCHCDRS
jgi:hypothetical protein